MNDEQARAVAGCATTGAILAAGHWLPWWRDLSKLAAYAFGCIAILIGQGIILKFNREWRRMCAVVLAGGAVVYGSYWYDALSNVRALRHVGDRGNGR